MTTIILIVVLIYVLAKLSSYVIAYFEPEHIKNDIEPRAYADSGWSSKYLDDRLKDATVLGLIPCGSYQTAKNASTVKGFIFLFQTPDHRTLVTLTSAKLMGTELRRVEFRTKFSDDSVIFTSDNTSLPDITDKTTKHCLYEQSFAELSEFHEVVIEQANREVKTFTPAQALQVYESMEVERASRMVAMGYARWTDSGQTKIRRTVKGTLEFVKRNRAAGKAIIAQALARQKQQAAQGKK